MLLQHSKVKRGGVTAQYWYGETEIIESEVTDAGLHLRFALPSKGGGTTDVLVILGADDLKPLLHELATRLPTLAEALAGATHVAVRQVFVERPR